MAQIHELEKRLRESFPGARLELSEPAFDDGSWSLDILHEGNALVVQWRKGGAFGLSSLEGHGYGEKPDEIYPDVAGTAKRILALLRTGSRTEPPSEVTLRELRAERNLSQVQLAELLGVEQPTISRLERHAGNMLLRTLNSVIQALGGKLDVWASFKDGTRHRLRFPLDDADQPREADATVVK